ncbi:MAG: hypothetical protein GX557_09180 [Chloroflexi bacterium]|nr:hypothetical protein [Chloroflexota bacterium]
MGWWRHFVELSDRERARALANAALGLILVLLYSLGGLSLYLRARYLSADRSTPTPTPTPTVASTFPAQAGPEPPATATLYPTLTPRGSLGGDQTGGTPWPTITPSPAP